MVARPFTIKDLYDDLNFASEAGSEFGYDLAEDIILVETYKDDGAIDKKYNVTIKIEELKKK